MPTLRALAANLAFYINTAVWMVVCLPLFALPRRHTIAAMKAWARMTMWLVRWTAGIDWDVRGLDNVPRTGERMDGVIIAAKHQSAWETFGLLPYLDDPAYILKKQLMHIPLFGWYAAKAGMIPVERSAHASALRKMARDAKKALDANRQIIIFPEGTRMAVGAPPDYKPGTTHLYKQLNAPLVPVALNSGLFWPRRQFARYPGTLVVSILTPIPPGGNPRSVRHALQESIEAETAKLVKDAQAVSPNQNRI